MLKKKQRLDRKSLNTFFKKKTASQPGNLLYLRYTINTLNIPRCAVIVSFAEGKTRKGRAVIRNLTKRRIMEVVDSLTSKIHPGFDMVFFVKIISKSASPAGWSAPKYAELKEDIIYVLHKSRISRGIL